MNREEILKVARELQLEKSGSGELVYFHGETMFPFLQEADEVVVESVAWDDIKPGDVVTFRQALNFPTRRVVEIENDPRRLIMRADHKLPQRFFFAQESDVLGRVQARKRGEDWLYPADDEWKDAAETALRAGREILALSTTRTPQSENSFSVHTNAVKMDLECLNTLVFILDEDYEAARYCLASVDHDVFRDFGHEHQLAGYLYAVHCEAGDRSPFFPELAASFKERFLRQWDRNEKLLSELVALEERFRQAGEEFILLKGLYLASRFYGDLARREILDIDLLVRPESFSKAAGLICECGFQTDSSTTLPRSVKARFIHEKVFQKNDIPLDLHHILRAFPGGSISQDLLWKGRTQAEFRGGSFNVLSDEHTVLNQILSIHHDIGLGTITLRGLVDLLMILRKVSGSLDWERFLAERGSEGTSQISVNVLALTLALFRCESQFPDIRELVRKHSGQLVVSPKTETILGLLGRWPLHRRKAWAFQQYPTSFLGAISWWLGGMPFFLATHRRIFFRSLLQRLRGTKTREASAPAPSAMPPTPEALGVTQGELEEGVLEFGSLRARIRFNNSRYIDMLGDLFRIDLQQSRGEDDGISLEIYLVEVQMKQVPVSNAWFIRNRTAGPVQPIIVKRESEGITSIYHDVAAAHIYENQTPPRVVVPVLGSGQSEAHLLHCLMVVFYKMLFHFGRAHVHAAAVKVGQGVNLFYGPKGAGKSTISLSLGRSGATVLAEDHIMLRRVDGQFWVSGCDGLMRITEETERHFFKEPLPTEPVSIAGTLKKEVDMNEFFSCSQCEDMPVSRLFFPYIGQSFSVRPLPPTTARDRLQRGLEERYRFANTADREAFASFFQSLTSCIESFDLELTSDLDELPKLAAFLRAEQKGVGS